MSDVVDIQAIDYLSALDDDALTELIQRLSLKEQALIRVNNRLAAAVRDLVWFKEKQIVIEISSEDDFKRKIDFICKYFTGLTSLEIKHVDDFPLDRELAIEVGQKLARSICGLANIVSPVLNPEILHPSPLFSAIGDLVAVAYVSQLTADGKRTAIAQLIDYQSITLKSAQEVQAKYGQIAALNPNLLLDLRLVFRVWLECSSTLRARVIQLRVDYTDYDYDYDEYEKEAIEAAFITLPNDLLALRKLYVDLETVDARVVQKVAQICPHLIEIEFSEAAIDKLGVDALSTLKHLTKLTLTNGSGSELRVNASAFVSAIEHFLQVKGKDMQKLRFTFYGFGDGDVAAVNQLLNMISLYCSHEQLEEFEINADGFAVLSPKNRLTIKRRAALNCFAKFINAARHLIDISKDVDVVVYKTDRVSEEVKAQLEDIATKAFAGQQKDITFTFKLPDSKDVQLKEQQMIEHAIEERIKIIEELPRRKPRIDFAAFMKAPLNINFNEHFD